MTTAALRKLIPSDNKDLLFKGGLALGAYFLVVKPLLIKFGVLDTAEDKATDKQEKEYATSPTSPFNPNYWKTVSKALILTQASVDAFADHLFEAIGTFSDDENAVYGVFRQLKAKTQVSYLSYVFFQKYKYDLYQYLSRNLSESEMGVINGIVSNLT